MPQTEPVAGRIAMQVVHVFAITEMMPSSNVTIAPHRG
jgi:hypothetical protein